jgi:hypothetical protein
MHSQNNISQFLHLAEIENSETFYCDIQTLWTIGHIGMGKTCAPENFCFLGHPNVHTVSHVFQIWHLKHFFMKEGT